MKKRSEQKKIKFIFLTIVMIIGVLVISPVVQTGPCSDSCGAGSPTTVCAGDDTGLGTKHCTTIDESGYCSSHIVEGCHDWGVYGYDSEGKYVYKALKTEYDYVYGSHSACDDVDSSGFPELCICEDQSTGQCTGVDPYCKADGVSCNYGYECCSSLCLGGVCKSCQSYCKTKGYDSGKCYPSKPAPDVTCPWKSCARSIINIGANNYCGSNYGCYCYNLESCYPLCSARCTASGCAPPPSENCCNRQDDDFDGKLDGEDTECSYNVNLNAGVNDVCWWSGGDFYIYQGTTYYSNYGRSRDYSSGIYSCPSGYVIKNINIYYDFDPDQYYGDALEIYNANGGAQLGRYYGGQDTTKNVGPFQTDKVYFRFISDSDNYYYGDGVKINSIECVMKQPENCCNGIDDDVDSFIDGHDEVDCEKNSNLNPGNNAICWAVMNWPDRTYISGTYSCPTGYGVKVGMTLTTSSSGAAIFSIRDANTGSDIKSYYTNYNGVAGPFPANKIYFRLYGYGGYAIGTFNAKINYIECVLPTTENCCNGVDDDLDGLPDGADVVDCRKDVNLNAGTNTVCWKTRSPYNLGDDYSSGVFTCPPGYKISNINLYRDISYYDYLYVMDGNGPLNQRLSTYTLATINNGYYGGAKTVDIGPYNTNKVYFWLWDTTRSGYLGATINSITCTIATCDPDTNQDCCNGKSDQPSVNANFPTLYDPAPPWDYCDTSTLNCFIRSGESYYYPHGGYSSSDISNGRSECCGDDNSEYYRANVGAARCCSTAFHCAINRVCVAAGSVKDNYCCFGGGNTQLCVTPNCATNGYVSGTNCYSGESCNPSGCSSEGCWPSSYSSPIKKTCSALLECKANECDTKECHYSNAGVYTWGDGFPATETACSDGHDNDCDGKIDNLDTNCGKSPINIDISPSSAAIDSGDSKTFTSTHSDADGWTNIRMIGFAICDANPATDWTTCIDGNLFYGYYTYNTSTPYAPYILWLYDHISNDWGLLCPYEKLVVCDAGPGEEWCTNDVCVAVDSLASSNSGTTLTATWPIKFKSTWVDENVNLYLYAEDRAGLNTGWQDMGDLQVTACDPRSGTSCGDCGTYDCNGLCKGDTTKSTSTSCGTGICAGTKQATCQADGYWSWDGCVGAPTSTSCGTRSCTTEFDNYCSDNNLCTYSDCTKYCDGSGNCANCNCQASCSSCGAVGRAPCPNYFSSDMTIFYQEGCDCINPCLVQSGDDVCGICEFPVYETVCQASTECKSVYSGAYPYGQSYYCTNDGGIWKWRASELPVGGPPVIGGLGTPPNPDRCGGNIDGCYVADYLDYYCSKETETCTYSSSPGDARCDITPPTITSCSPSSATSATPTFTCSVNENAWCRMSLNDESYDGMADNWDCTGDGTKTISCQVQTPQSETTSKLYYIACKDNLDNKNSAANNYHHTYYRSQSDFSAPIRSNGKPTGIIATTSATLQVTTEDTNPPVRCKYSTTSQSYDSMPSTFQNTDGTTSTFTHTQPLSGLPEGQNKLYVRCKDNLNNKNTDDYTITFTVDTTPPTQDSITVSNPYWKIDGTTTQTITLKSTEAGSGIGGTYGMMALIFQDTHWANARGYFGWSPTKYIHGADRMACSGGGYASKSTSYGAEYITLIDCSTSVSGNQRTVTFTVRPNTNFGDLTGMDIAFHTTDIAGNTGSWKDFNDLFSSDGTAPTSGWTDSSFATYDKDGTASATTICSDDPSGIKDVYVAWKENNQWTGYVYKPHPYTCTSTGSDGQYLQCAVRCRDNAGNLDASWDYTTNSLVDTVPPTQDSVTVSNSLWKTDGTTTQTITLKSTESGSGIGGTYGMMALIFQDTHWANARGYFGWSPTKYIHGADNIACSGGGYASKSTSYGAEYITLTACSTSVSGNQRTVTFTVKPNTNFGDLTGMDIAFHTSDLAGNTGSWKDFNDLFSSDGTPPTSGWTGSGFQTYAKSGARSATTWCSDDPSGIKDVYVAWKENNQWTGYVYKPHPYTCTSTGSDGQYLQCAVRCRDNAGNLDASWDYTTNSLVDTVPPTQDSVTVSNSLWKIDGTTTQTITLKSTEAGSGIGGTYGMMALIFKDTHWNNARGYFGWNPTKYIHGADNIACSGGGYASKSTSYGAEYITLTACSTSVSGNQRTVTFTVKPNTNFGDLTGMDIAFHTSDLAGWFGAWKDFNDLFSSDGTAPTHDSLTVSNQYWKIDGITTQAITLKSTETGIGIGGTYGIMALINYQGSNAGNYRGYFAWHPTKYVWTEDRISCQGGGYASKYAGYGNGYITLTACSTSESGNQRTVTFTVKPNTNFGDFGAINDISMYTSDALNNYRGWTLFDINFASDGTPPTGTVSINNGEKYTTSESVNLTLSCSDATSPPCEKMMFSNDDLTWLEENYATLKLWTLPSGDGSKTVYVKFKDSAGNWMTSPATDTIILDKTRPTFISYSVANCDYIEGTTCWVKPGTTTHHTIKHYDGTSTPYIQYLTFTKDTCTPNACSSGNEIKSYIYVDTGTFKDWMSNNNYLDIRSANCIGTCTAQYAEEEWKVVTGNTEGNFQIWTFLYDEVWNGVGYTKVGWWYKIDSTLPVRSNGQPKGTDLITTDSTTISLTTNEPATCRYSTTSNTPYDSMTSPTTSLGTSHSWQITGLIDGTKYYYIRCRDRVGNLNNDDYTITFTVNIPEICNNNKDDDGNNLKDCKDPDCIGTGIGPNGGLCCDDFITHYQCTFNERCDEGLKECIDVLAGYNPECCLNYDECIALVNEPCFPEIDSADDCPKHAVFTLVDECLTQNEKCRGYCCQACLKIGRVDSCP